MNKKICCYTVFFAFLIAAMAWGCGPKPSTEHAIIKTPGHTVATAHGRAPVNKEISVSVTGLVRQPIHYTSMDFKNFQSISVRLNDVMRDGSFRGAFMLRGIPLRTLLDQAHIKKESGIFNRSMDLAVVVRGAKGETTVLSWGEIYYRNPGEVVLAYDSSPVVPHKSCAKCHDEETAKPWQDKMFRAIAWPKLVLTRDHYSDRSIEEVVSIEVVDLGEKVGIQLAKKDAPDELQSDQVELTDSAGKKIVIKDLAGFERLKKDVAQVGDGTGYHGIRHYEGVSLKSVLEKNGYGPNPSQAFVLSAPDGYRVLLSNGEIFEVPGGKEILLADKFNGSDLEEGGKFQLVPVDDHSADRWLKSVTTIDAVKVQRDPRVYVVGMGPGDTSLITLEAISTIAKADVLVAPVDITTRFEKYLAGKEVLFDSLSLMKPKEREKLNSLPKEEREKVFASTRKEDVRIIKKALDEGKTVAFLDYGDPTIFGTWRFMQESEIPEDKITIIPGISSVNAGSAIVGRDINAAGALVVGSPRELIENKSLAKSLAQGGETVALIVGLHDVDATAKALTSSFPKETPVAIVYRAGFRSTEQIVRTTVEKFAEEANKNKEKHLGIIYVGRHII